MGCNGNGSGNGNDHGNGNGSGSVPSPGGARGIRSGDVVDTPNGFVVVA